MGNPMRVLHVVVNMNRGGAETLLMNLYRNIDRAKVQFDFLTCKAGVFDAEIIAMGGKIHRIPYVTEVGHKRYLKELDNFFIINNSYKIVHAHMDKMSGLVLRAAKKAKIPVRIAHSHNTRSEGGIASRLYKWHAGNNIKPNATHLYACSSTAAKWLYGKANTTSILKNGIVTDNFRYTSSISGIMRKQLDLKKDSFVLGHVGRFSKQKNHMYLLELFSDLKKKLPNAVLVLVGDGPLKSNIMEKIKALHLENDVKLLGVREDIENLFQVFDIFIFPSIHEGLPVTLIEAQGAGLPCLVSSAVTKEVDMGIGLVEFLSLTDKMCWTNTLMRKSATIHSRTIDPEALSIKGYDIRQTAKFIQKSYLSYSGSS
ncbi:glycosyltransferase family 1 protein [Virgibacillus flavescens]|uniref:glycosyltransferase family 1 protein n=1 Tax=Virgibacillus flavescens TaxID=1611422 RepID=UPI003D34B7A7